RPRAVRRLARGQSVTRWVPQEGNENGWRRPVHHHTYGVATLVAVCLAAVPAWGHSFPPVRTIVVQVEHDEVALLIGYRPGSGDATDNIIARAGSQPKSRALEVMREVMEAYALAPIAVTVDGKPLVPT